MLTSTAQLPSGPMARLQEAHDIHDPEMGNTATGCDRHCDYAVLFVQDRQGMGHTGTG